MGGESASSKLPHPAPVQPFTRHGGGRHQLEVPLWLIRWGPYLPFSSCTTLTSTKDLASHRPKKLEASLCGSLNSSPSSFATLDLPYRPLSKRPLFWDCFTCLSHFHPISSFISSVTLYSVFPLGWDPVSVVLSTSFLRKCHWYAYHGCWNN